MYSYPPDGVLLAKIEDINKIKLDPKNGESLVNKYLICGYDESIYKFNGLEGTAYLTSHSLIIQKDEYIPTIITTFYFYTRSKLIKDNSKCIKYSEDVETDSKMDYVYDRNEFLVNYTPSNSIILIDGPLIGGQISSYTVRLNEKLLSNNILPIFFIKNSLSTLVIDNIKELKGKYNSDMHWAYNILKPGERTNFFRYQDLKSNQAKIFCYLKAYNLTPQRIELHINTFEKYKNNIPQLMDLIYYLILVQGDIKNPQIRSIAIAEKYARSTLKLFNIDSIMKNLGLAPTLNQIRFG